MRIKSFNSTLSDGGDLVSPAGYVNGAVLLGEEGNTPFSAVTKSYVDNKLSNFSASQITSGYIPAMYLPGFSGAATVTEGSVTGFTLQVSGVTPGTYTKYVADGEGRLSSGGSLTAVDIPSVSYATVTDKPTTTEGYGITDSLSLSGGNVGQNLTMTTHPTTSTHVATVGYVTDTMVTGEGGMAVGTIIQIPNGGDTTGMLRCNGATLDIATYGNLYNVIGDKFSSAASVGNGRPWVMQADFNSQENGTLGDWYAQTALNAVFTRSQMAVWNNRVFVVSGKNATTFTTVVRYCDIMDNGDLDYWTNGTSLSQSRSETQIVAVNGMLYLIGGKGMSGPTAVISGVVYRGAINAAGISSWNSTSPALPVGSYGHSTIVLGGSIYVIGGFNATFTKVYRADLNSSGFITTWSESGDIPGILGLSQLVNTGKRLYLLGGSTDDADTVSTVYTAPINADSTIGTWTEGPSLPTPLKGSQSVTIRNRVYLLGGHDGTNYRDTIWSAPINEDGTIGTWIEDGLLPIAVAYHQVLVVKNKLYLLSGTTAANAATTMVYATDFLGGYNDYSELFTNTFNTLGEGYFQIPMLEHLSDTNSTYYIKY